jgi:hypothetical protein
MHRLQLWMLLIFACLSKSGHRRLEGFFEDFGMERQSSCWLLRRKQVHVFQSHVQE